MAPPFRRRWIGNARERAPTASTTAIETQSSVQVRGAKRARLWALISISSLEHPFPHLSAELRNNIYELSLQGPTPIEVLGPHSPECPDHIVITPPYGLLTFHKVFRHLAGEILGYRPAYYSMNSFEFDLRLPEAEDLFKQWLKCTPGVATNVKKLFFNHYTWSYDATQGAWKHAEDYTAVILDPEGQITFANGGTDDRADDPCTCNPMQTLEGPAYAEQLDLARYLVRTISAAGRSDAQTRFLELALQFVAVVRVQGEALWREARDIQLCRVCIGQRVYYSMTGGPREPDFETALNEEIDTSTEFALQEIYEYSGAGNWADEELKEWLRL